MPEWKDTVNLPRTDFPMKANLPTSEPQMLARWREMDPDGRIRERRNGAPYLTMNFKYQAAIARAFGRFVAQDLVYKGKKPVHWCIHCRTALAEAEVEYEDHTSPSIYVEFPLDRSSAAELGTRVPALVGK